MNWFDVIVCIIIGFIVITVGFICVVIWLIDAGLKSKYKDDQKDLNK